MAPAAMSWSISPPSSRFRARGMNPKMMAKEIMARGRSRILAALMTASRGESRRLIDLTLTPPRARIASYLLLLAEMQNSKSIALPVPRKELANFLGMTHETFYHIARELTNVGLVQFTGQSVGILDRAGWWK